jgi:hypothetical protein
MFDPHVFILDTHVHYYAQFSPDDLCRNAVRNLERQATDSLPGIVLVDKAEWPTYDDFVSNLTAMSDFRVETHRDHAVIIFSEDDLVHRLYVFRGAQRIVKEGFEMLCLFNSELSFDRQSAEDLITEINALGGIAVVPWSYGKWLGKRRTMIRELCLKCRERGHPLFLGDICQRPRFVDNLKMLAQKWGAAGVLGGSDPLPYEGEEACIGMLGTLIDVAANYRSLTVVSELKKSLLGLAGADSSIGLHDSVVKGLYRWARYSTASN